MGCLNPIDKGVELNDLVVLREHGHVLRGAFLDAFARLERAVMDQIIGLRLKAAPGASLCQKMGRLTDARELFSDPEKLDVQLRAISRLNDARTDIVHAVLTVTVRYDGNKPMDHWFGFQNACDDAKPLRSVTADELKAMVREAMQLATWLKKQRAVAPAAPATANAQAAQPTPQ